MDRLIKSFKACDQFGNTYLIHVLQGYHKVVGELGQTKLSEDKLFEMRTDDGHFVQPCEGGFEVIIGTEHVLLTTDDPNAPECIV